MKHDPKFQESLAAPAWKRPDEARRELENHMDAFFLATLASAGTALEPAPALSFRVSPGLGKTSCMQRLLVRHGRGLLTRGHVLVYVPTLDLAERAADDLVKLDPGLPVTVVRGRRAKDSAGNKSMCERLELVESAEGLVPSVTEALCRVEVQGEMRGAPCAAGCPYLAQMDVRGAQIVFLAHSYLGLRPPIDLSVPVAMRIVDEKVWPVLVRDSWTFVSDFLGVPPPWFPERLRSQLIRARVVIFDALETAAPLHDRLAQEGFTPEALLELADAEAAIQPRPQIRPWMAERTSRRLLHQVDAKHLKASRQREQILRIAASRRSGSCGRLQLDEMPLDDTRSLEIIRVFDMAEFPRDSPVLLLDADADPEITSRMLPGAEFIKLDVAPRAHVVQVSDRTLSHAWLAVPDTMQERIQGILSIVEREVADVSGNGVLLVATRPVLAMLHQAEGQRANCDQDLMKPIRGASPRWFGPRMQGFNDYRDFSVVITIGRLQPGPADVERDARCVFGGDEVPLKMLASGRFEPRGAWRMMRDGRFVDAIVQTHPDKRAERILMQMREAGTLQAVARLRLLTPSRPKRVLLVSSLPLPDFPVDHLTTWDALVCGIEDDPDPAGFKELEKALDKDSGQPVWGTRLSAAGLHADLSAHFSKKGATERFRRGRGTAAMVGLVQRIAAANCWPPTEVELSAPGKGGKGSVAQIL